MVNADSKQSCADAEQTPGLQSKDRRRQPASKNYLPLLPTQQRKPSQEHYQMISRILSEVDASSDPDLYCVYVCVHKRRTAIARTVGRNAEAPF